MKFSILASTLGCAVGVIAHGGVLQYQFNGTWYWGFVPYNTEVGQTTIQRIWNTYNPIQDVTLETVACNDNGTSPDAQLTATINAGISVTGYWNNPWPHNTGPLLAYLGECPSTGCTGVSPNSLSWFKIAHLGLISGTVYNGTWAAGQMIANNNSWTITIPATVPNGYYLLRMETIALHSLPAQNYPECAQVYIQNGGTVKPASSILVNFPGAYAQTDPGLDIDIYGAAAMTQTTYIIPGPSLYPGTATSSSTTTTTTTTTTTKSTSTSTTTSTSSSSSSSTTTSTSATATQTEYGQCGGIGWTGATVCAAPYTCTELNTYYYQCT